MKKIMYIAAALLVLVGCQKSQEAKENAPVNYGTITGKIELPQGPNKIAAPDDWKDKTEAFTMQWEEGDKIYIVNESGMKLLTLKSIDEEGVATFEGELLSDMNSFQVAYGFDPSGQLTDVAVPYIENNYRPFAMGESTTPESFKIEYFLPVLGLPLKGTDALTEIEIIIALTDKGKSFTNTMFFDTPLQLTSTSQTIYFPTMSDVVVGSITLTFNFYNVEGLIMTKTVNNVHYYMNQVVTFESDLEVADPYNGHEYVDLGLPSGLKWATCNVGATTPEGYGDYFVWGETEPYYSSLSPLTWKTGKEFGYSWQSYCDSYEFVEWNPAPYDATTKNLKPEFDAATANWGGNWRMPTKAEQDELREKCTWTWTQKNGINGYEVKSKSNDNTIFLPASGGYVNLSVGSVGFEGLYWSSSLPENGSQNAYYLYFTSLSEAWSNYFRSYGFPIRPVCQ